MNDYAELRILPRVTARTPQHLGVNVEIQECHDEINLWDWLVDSGSTVVREFHPEQPLCDPADPDRFADIDGKAAFEAFRERLRGEPGGPDRRTRRGAPGPRRNTMTGQARLMR